MDLNKWQRLVKFPDLISKAAPYFSVDSFTIVANICWPYLNDSLVLIVSLGVSHGESLYVESKGSKNFKIELFPWIIKSYHGFDLRQSRGKAFILCPDGLLNAVKSLDLVGKKYGPRVERPNEIG